ncbi:hypothetical protein O3M35_006262 [Rhynocoris fuscipes]|uniref:tRNA-splicing endonuclease subunit Sen54 N-terminal domain-containing protein n=1 Tax=Rhynocoris fuscipes TaxID=488301 RepID=A0AAW1DFF0_9HEMI
MKLLSGSEIIQQKLNGPKELPSSGWKDYCPSNSWLEQKQIQASLDDKHLTLGVERIEKQNNLARAEWIQDCKRAKVLKKVGKHWEVVGHHQDDEDWLYPEEALYLLEINVLELLYGGVPVSVEHAYALLLGEFHFCSLQEYRVYSYLSRKGYKLIRHAEEVTVTRYEKQIHLDQVLETQKRNIPSETSKIDSSSEVSKNLSENSETNITESIIEELPSNEENLVENKKKPTGKRAISDSEDVCIIEDNIEVIEIEDFTCKKSILKSPDIESHKTHDIIDTSNKSKIQKSEKSVTSECCIVIDDDDNNEIEDMEIKQQSDSDSSECSSDDDVVLVRTVRLGSREWYKPLRKCLIPSHIEVIDLSDDVEIKTEKLSNDSLQILSSKSVKDILNEMTSAGSGETFIKKPNSVFLPKGIVPKYAQYKVNLNKRQETIYPNQNNFNFTARRQQQHFYNPNFSNNQSNNTFLGDNVYMKAYEMRAMGISMIQAASSLMSAVNPQRTDPSLMNNISSLLNPTQFSNPNYTPRLFNNNMFNNNHFNNISTSNNLFNSNLFGNPRFMHRNSYGRRNYRFFRGYRNNNSRGQQKQMPRYFYNNKNNSNISELVTIDSDDEFNEKKTKRRINRTELPSKKSRPFKSFELIDLCEDDKPVKPEPAETNRNKPSTSTKQEHVECKEEIDNGAKDRLNSEKAVLHPKKESDVRLKVEPEKEIISVTENEISTEMECDDEIKIKSIEKSLTVSHENFEESSQDKLDSNCSQSPQIVETSNITEMDNVESSAVEDEVELFEKDTENEEITCWQQYKEQTGVEVETRTEGGPLIQPDQIKDLAEVLKNLQIFETIDTQAEDKTSKFKISFDAYLPTDHFKKSLKMLPKFRIIVVNSSDSLPTNSEIDTLKSSYQDGIPFLYAAVYDDTISFYLYDSVSLPEYFHD